MYYITNYNIMMRHTASFSIKKSSCPDVRKRQKRIAVKSRRYMKKIITNDYGSKLTKPGKLNLLRK